jgi:hypothetical protein
LKDRAGSEPDKYLILLNLSLADKVLNPLQQGQTSALTRIQGRADPLLANLPSELWGYGSLRGLDWTHPPSLLPENQL